MNIEKCFHTKNPDYQKDRIGKDIPRIKVNEIKNSDEQFPDNKETNLKNVKPKTHSWRFGKDFFIALIITVALLLIAFLFISLLQ